AVLLPALIRRLRDFGSGFVPFGPCPFGKMVLESSLLPLFAVVVKLRGASHILSLVGLATHLIVLRWRTAEHLAPGRARSLLFPPALVLSRRTRSWQWGSVKIIGHLLRCVVPAVRILFGTSLGG